MSGPRACRALNCTLVLVSYRPRAPCCSRPRIAASPTMARWRLAWPRAVWLLLSAIMALAHSFKSGSGAGGGAVVGGGMPADVMI